MAMIPVLYRHLPMPRWITLPWGQLRVIDPEEAARVAEAEVTRVGARADNVLSTHHLQDGTTPIVVPVLNPPLRRRKTLPVRLELVATRPRRLDDHRSLTFFRICAAPENQAMQ